MELVRVTFYSFSLHSDVQQNMNGPTKTSGAEREIKFHKLGKVRR